MHRQKAQKHPRYEHAINFFNLSAEPLCAVAGGICCHITSSEREQQVQHVINKQTHRHQSRICRPN